jgi:hypothetical protein
MPSAPTACGKQPRPLQELVGSPCYPGAKGVKPEIAPRAYFLRHRNTPKVFPVTRDSVRR